MAITYKRLNHSAEEIDEAIISEKTHVNDNVSHITATEREKWNNSVNALTDLKSIRRENLLNFDNMTAGFIDETSQTILNYLNAPVANSYNVVSDYIEIDPTQSYYYQSWQNSIEGTDKWCGFGYYDENKTYIKRQADTTTDYHQVVKLDIPKSARYVRVNYRSIFGGKFKFENSFSPTDYCYKHENEENLLKATGYIRNYGIANTGKLTETEIPYFVSHIINVTAGEKYYFNYTSTGSPVSSYALYDSNMNLITFKTKNIDTKDKYYRIQHEIDIPENACYMRVCGRLENMVECEVVKNSEVFNTKTRAASAPFEINAILNGLSAETFTFGLASTYPDPTTFEWTEASGKFAISNISAKTGGLLSVSFDETVVKNACIKLFLFDKNMNPYKCTDIADHLTNGKCFAGENYEPTYKTPASATSYSTLGGSFTTIIPENCHVMILFQLYLEWTGIYPEGEILSFSNPATNFAQWVKNGGIRCHLFPIAEAKTESSSFVKGIAHRGYSKYAPENTMPAYEMAVDYGFKYVECDVAFTSDNIPVLLHDNTINRTSNGTGDISTLTYEEVSQYDFGSWFDESFVDTKIPTFEEFLLFCRNRGVYPYIELKAITVSQIKMLVDMTKKYGMIDKATWICFSPDNIGTLKDYYNKARLGYIIYSVTEDEIEIAKTLLTGKNEVFINCNYANVTDEMVELCISNNFPLEVWTVDSSSAVKTLNPYVSGISTNYLNIAEILK